MNSDLIYQQKLFDIQLENEYRRTNFPIMKMSYKNFDCQKFFGQGSKLSGSIFAFRRFFT